MSSEKLDLHALFLPAVQSMNYELVGVELVPAGKHSTLRVYVDHEDGVCIDVIAEISHQISAILDLEDPIPGHYTLEVSSPGLDRPLFTMAHYERFIGKRVKLRCRRMLDGRRHFSGKMLDVKDHQITIQVEDGETFVLDFDQIEKGNLIAEL